MNEQVIHAHKFCTNNREMLKNDSVCGCFYCLRIFSPDEITDWIHDKSETARCPYCGIDSVLPKSAGYTLTKEFLKDMYDYWFRVL